MQGFGLHLTLDGYGCNSKKLKDIELLYSVLDSLPDRINMTKITKPFTIEYVGKKKEDWGLSGFILIAESHISIHTFPDKQYISADIFSCKEFNVNKALDYLIKMFGIQKHEKNISNRGLEFPKNIEKSKQVVEKQRSRIPVLTHSVF